MNKKISFLLILLGFTFLSFAQKRFSEGIINYNIIIKTGSDKPQAADFFDGATSTVYLKGAKSRIEMVSSLGTQATIMDETKNAVNIIKEYGEQKYIIQLTPSNWKDANKKYDGVTFTYVNESKNINGYNCKKAIGKLSDGTTFIVWYTPELIPENRNFQPVNASLPGLAMEYEASIGNLNVTYTVSKISFSPVPAVKFDLPKAGYRIITYEESKGS